MDSPNLSKIMQGAKRWDLFGSSIQKYYPGAARGMFHGVYSVSMDRFVLVDGLDLDIVCEAAKLLSSKMITYAVIFPTVSPIAPSTCLNWRIKIADPIRLSSFERPRIVLLESIKDLDEIGLPLSAEENWLAPQMEYIAFVLRANYAIRLTEAFLNQTDHAFFMRFFPSIRGSEDLKYSQFVDGIRWPEGFVTTLQRILYLAGSVEEALGEIKKLLPYPKDPLRHVYSKMFYELLGIELGGG